jgi:hypothetical protein
MSLDRIRGWLRLARGTGATADVAAAPAAVASEQEEEPENDRYAAHREKWDFWSHALLRGSEDLRALLHVDETNFRFVAGTAHGNSRDYFLYAVLDEIEKLGIAIMGWDEIIGPEEIVVDTATTRVILERTLDEQSFWLRKTIEALIDLVCFSSTNEDPYFRHLLLLRQLRAHLSVQQDLTDFYGAGSRNVEWSIERVYEEIRELEDGDIDFGRVWYARAALRDLPTRPDGLLTSVRARLRKALPLMDPHEKLSAGLSYARAYGSTSEDIHFRPQATLRDISTDAVAAGIDRIAVEGVAVIRRVQLLLGEVPAGVNEQLRDSFDANEFPAEVLARRTANRADVGDFVLAGGDLAEVLETRQSEFGYEVYRARYLAERPLPDVEEDWFLAEHIERFYTAETFLEKMRDAVAEGLVPADALARIERLPPGQRQDMIRESLLFTWEHGGLRDWVRNRQREIAAAPNPYAPRDADADEDADG